MQIMAVDLFCGIGGLSYGLKKSGIQVVAGIDIDKTCKFAFEKNVGGKFISKDISEISGKQLISRYWKEPSTIKILVGCAPCQPFSTHSNKIKERTKSKKWNLLLEFERLIKEINPEIVSMENVPNLANQQIFSSFVQSLIEKGYYVSYSNVYCPDYGIPQKRRRLVLLASRLGKIKLIDHTHKKDNYVSLKSIIGDLPEISAGEICKSDPLHRASKLSEINLKRIKASKPDGTWLDWDKNILLECHKKKSGSTYRAVYGRMNWEDPSSTITTQFINYGTGRFGHPVQNRAISIREGALLQTFPKDYIFFNKVKEISIKRLAQHIGNAVPVDLGYVIGQSIRKHLGDYNGTE